jgi:AcrR family transcriptional regulator
MGHREDLLAGAKRCLFEKGYARTTARDIVAASGTNLASIGYHFGSKEALLNAALIDAMREMGREMTKISTPEKSADAWTWDDLATGWTNVVEMFQSYRNLMVAQTEAWAQAERSPELRAELAELYRQELTRQQGEELDALRQAFREVLRETP